jgi:hypothetical protein
MSPSRPKSMSVDDVVSIYAIKTHSVLSTAVPKARPIAGSPTFAMLESSGAMTAPSMTAARAYHLYLGLSWRVLRTVATGGQTYARNG